jgi:transcription elongation factor GreA
MRLPIRKSEQLHQSKQEPSSPYLTKEGLDRLKQKLQRLKIQELPQAIEDVRRTAEFGDFSENAEYQEAKARMRRLHTQIFSLEEKIKQAVVIEKNGSSGEIALGSTVMVRSNGKNRVFEIVGPQESDPTHHRISHLSPLGTRLMGKTVGDIVKLQTLSGEILYRIVKID